MVKADAKKIDSRRSGCLRDVRKKERCGREVPFYFRGSRRSIIEVKQVLHLLLRFTACIMVHEKCVLRSSERTSLREVSPSRVGADAGYDDDLLIEF